MSIDDDLRRARELLGSAERVVFFTGAGMSADSGIPTFRGSGGLWRGVRPEELATPEAFAADPRKVIDWYRWRRSLIAAASPHPGHRAVARYCRQHPGAAVVTQNVDGLHQRSGCPTVHELHGSIWVDRCDLCGEERALDPAGHLEGEGAPLPHCPCGGIARPGVVWFGEGLPEEAWRRSLDALTAADAVVIVGTSAVVQPAASLVGRAPPDAVCIEVDPHPTSPRALRLAGPAADRLPSLLAPEAP